MLSCGSIFKVVRTSRGYKIPVREEKFTYNGILWIMVQYKFGSLSAVTENTI